MDPDVLHMPWSNHDSPPAPVPRRGNDGEDTEEPANALPVEQQPPSGAARRPHAHQEQQTGVLPANAVYQTKDQDLVAVTMALHLDSVVTDPSPPSTTPSPPHQLTPGSPPSDPPPALKSANRDGSSDNFSQLQTPHNEEIHDWEWEPETSDPNYRDQAWFLQAFLPMNDKRHAVAGLRYKVREDRHRLRSTRDTLDERENQLMQKLRFFFVGDRQNDLASFVKNLDALKQLQDDLQDARDSFKHEEEEYDMLEDALLNDEWFLKEIEKAVYQRAYESFKSMQMYRPNSGPTTPTISPIPVESNTSPVDSVISVAGRWIDLLRARDELKYELQDLHAERESLAGRWIDLLRTRDELKHELQDLHAERESLAKDEQLRMDLNMSLDKDVSARLRSIPGRKIGLEQQLSAIEEDLSKLRQMVEDQTDIHFSMHQFAETVTSPSARDSLDSDRSDPLAEQNHVETPEPSSEDSLHSDPLLLSYEVISEVFPAAGHANEREMITPITFINDWLLYALRRSILQVSRFKSAKVLQGLEIDRETFKTLVLSWWFRDELSSPQVTEQEGAASVEPSLWTNTVKTRNTRARTEPRLPGFNSAKRPRRQSRSLCDEDPAER